MQQNRFLEVIEWCRLNSGPLGFFQPFQTFTEREEMITKANAERKGYAIVRTIQQALTPYLPAVRHHFTQYKDCKACKLGCSLNLKNHVFYRGYIPCDILFVGDAPTLEEDGLARPFLGDRGAVLDSIIRETSLRLTAEDEGGPKDNSFRWCVTTAVLCAPDVNGEPRPPTAQEVKACSTRLLTFIHIAAPAVIVSLGNLAEKAMQQIKVRKIEFDPSAHKDELGRRIQTPFTPAHINIPDPEWIDKQPDTNLQIKKAVLTLHQLLKPLWN